MIDSRSTTEATANESPPLNVSATAEAMVGFPTAAPEPAVESNVDEGASCASLPAYLARDFGTLAAVATSMSVMDGLADAGPLTIFAPTNDAFAAIPPPTADSLLTDADLLTSVLQYHIVKGAIRSEDMSVGDLTTLSGSRLSVRKDVDTTTVNTATLTDVDHEAGECVVHAIDSVLVPPGLLNTVGARSLNVAVGGQPIEFVDGGSTLTDEDEATLAAICSLVAGERNADGFPGVQWRPANKPAIDTVRLEVLKEALDSCGLVGLATEELNATIRPSFTG